MRYVTWIWEVMKVNEIWANRLIAGDKAWSNVPANRKKAVKAVLAKRVEDSIIDADLYEKITDETYNNYGQEE